MKSHRWRHRHSLSARLVWLFAAMAVIFVVLVGGAMSFAFKHGFEDRLQPHLVRYLEYVQSDIGSPPDIVRAQALADRLPVEIHIFNSDQTWSSIGTAPDLNAMEIHRRISQNGVDYSVGEFNHREYLVSHHPGYSLAFAIPHTRGSLHWRLAIPVSILLLILMLLHHATRSLFRPIKTLKEGVERIGHGELDHRVEINRRDELGDLAKSVNAMASDIQQMLEAKRQLLLAISHELRSPLTRAKVSLELLDDTNQRHELNRELNDMEQLIEELLETERLSTRHRILDKTESSLNELVPQFVAENFGDSSIRLDIPSEEIRANIDATRIKLMLKNLLENSLRHNGPDSQPPLLSLEQDQDELVFTVQDYGEGIEEQHLPHLTEPFYRVDPARQRQTGGYGLGLYLCRVIAEAHGGTLEIKSRRGSGTTIVVRLPISTTD